MKLLTAATLVALNFGAGAHASHGADQLASSLGVEPGAHSLSQLAQLQGLRDRDGEGTQLLIEEILEHPEGEQGDRQTHHRTPLDRNAEGWRNLALSLGVEPGRYSPQQLVGLKSAMEQNDQKRIAFIMSKGSADGNSVRPQVSSGAAQLARSLGVEPGLYSMSQLVQLKSFDGDSENNFRMRQILENPEFG